MNKTKKPPLSIIIPFYNEAKNISLVLREYQKIYTSNKIPFELICVNNGSTDNSAKEFKKFLHLKKFHFVKVVPVSINKGYGYGIMYGVKKASGEVISWTHADMQTDPIDVLRAYEVFKKQNDNKVIVKGIRVKRPLQAFLFSFGMAFISSVMLRKLFFEVNAQPKLFHKSFLPLLKNAPDDFSLDLYLLYQAKTHAYKILTINVLFKKRIHGQSRWAYSLSSRIRTIRRTLQYISALRSKI